MDVQRPYGRWRLGAPVFVLGFLASLVAGAALARTSLFLPGAGGAELRTYYTGSGLAVLVASLLQLTAAVGLVGFGTGAATALGAGRRATSATWLAAAAFALSGALSLVLAAIAGHVGDGTLMLLGRLTLALGGPVHLAGLAGLLWSTSRHALANGRGPRWIWRFGVLVSPLLLASVISLALPAATKVEPLWRLLTAVWLIAVATTGARPADQRREPSLRTVPQAVRNSSSR